MKEEYIEELLAGAERHGALRRSVRQRCDELDGRLASCSTATHHRYHRLTAAALTILVIAAGALNYALAAQQPDTLRCNSDCSTEEIINMADGVIASCRQTPTI